MLGSNSNQHNSSNSHENEWFTLDELAIRWHCTKEDVLQKGVNNDLRICFKFKEVIATWCDFSGFNEKGVIYPNFLQDAYFLMCETLGVFPDDLKKLIDKEVGVRPFKLLPSTLLPSDNKFSKFLDVRLYPSEDNFDEIIPRSDIINIDGLGVVWRELERFESERKNSEQTTHADRALDQSCCAKEKWVARAREINATLNQHLKQVFRADEITKQLLAEGYLGRGGRPITPENIIREALRNR